MDKKIIRTLLVGILIFGILAATYIWGDYISPDNTGAAYQAEQIVRSILVILLAWVCMRLAFVCFIDPINKRRARHLPNIIKDIIGVVIFIIAGIFIITSIYNQPAFSIVTALVAPGIGIGLACQDILKDCIAGINMDLQDDFSIGDWVKLPDGTEGKIIEMKITGIDVLLPNNTVLFLGNAAIADKLINLNKPTRDFYGEINVMIEHGVPVERARRIIQGAVISAKGVYNNEAIVVAESVNHSGILFIVLFKVPDRDFLFETRHQVISSVVKNLHKFGMKICQISGELNINNVTKKQYIFDDNIVTNARDSLEMSGLLDGCDDSLKEHFAKRMSMLPFEKGETIVSSGEEGETMYIIAEGAVDVLFEVKINGSDEEVRVSNVACITAGGYFGEMALLQGEKRNATVVAKTDVIVYEIKRSAVKWFVKEYPDFARKLSLSIVRRNLANKSTEKDLISSHFEEERIASEFMDAFKSFLGRDW